MASPSKIDVALSDRARPPAHRARDARDHTGDVLRFVGIRPGDKVIDFLPFHGYFTRLFSDLVGPTGHVYAAIPRALLKIDRIAAGKTDVAALARTRENISFLEGPLETAASPPSGIDLFWIYGNYHDLHDAFMGSIDIAAFNLAAFKSLRPGGHMIIGDHNAGARPADNVTERLHRIGVSQTKREMTAAGFKYKSSSGILHNPKDPHTASVFARGIRYHTDRFVLKFRKGT